MIDLRSRILAGDTLIGVFADLASPLAAELCGTAGFDWIALDLEHGESTEADLLALLYATETTGMAAIVRPQSAERLRVGRALDLGAAGIILPQLQSIDDVRAAVDWLRYPPVGQRGVALRTRGADMGAIGHGDVARVVNARIAGIVQIESRGALAAVEEIAALEPVDALFVGPADLSHALGIPGQFGESAYRAALQSVVTAAERHGKAAGILVYDTAAVPDLLELGFRFIGLGSQGSFVSAGARAMLAAAGR